MYLVYSIKIGWMAGYNNDIYQLPLEKIKGTFNILMVSFYSFSTCFFEYISVASCNSKIIFSSFLSVDL